MKLYLLNPGNPLYNKMNSLISNPFAIVTLFVGIATGIAMFRLNCCKKRSKTVETTIRHSETKNNDYGLLWARNANYPYYKGDRDNPTIFKPMDSNDPSNCGITNVMTMRNPNLPGIENVDISGVIRLPFDMIRKNFGVNTKTIRINSDMENIETIMNFIQFCPNLESLHVENCNSLTYSYYRVRQCPNIKSITFINCEMMSGDLFTFSMCKNLESLTIRRCPKMLIDLTQYEFPCLKFLSTDGGMKYNCLNFVNENIPSLTHVDLSGSKYISSISIYKDYYHKCGVTDLNLSGCENLRYVSWGAFSSLTTVTIDSKTNTPVKAVCHMMELNGNILKVVQGIESN